MVYSPEEVLAMVEVRDGTLVYKNRMTNMRVQIGDSVAVVVRNGKPHYQIGEGVYAPPKLLAAVGAQDPELLVNRSRTDRTRVTPRDLEILGRIQKGEVYADIGATYGVSRQRVKQVADKLSRAGYEVPTVSARREPAKADRHNALMGARYGHAWDAFTDDPELREAIMKRFTAKRNNALAKGIEFTLTPSDWLPLPTHCPVLGIPITYTGNTGAEDSSLSIDRIDPSKGYVPGNVVFVSQRANRIKNDATPDELRKIADFYQLLTKNPADE